MHRILTALLAFVAIVGGWLAYDYRARLAAKDAQITALIAERDAARAAEKSALAGMDPLKENIERLIRERDRLQAQAKIPSEQGSAPEGSMPPRGPAGNEGRPNLGGLAAMLSTPEGKKMFQVQSASVVRNQYSELAKRMKLSPQDTTVLMGLLADRQTALATARATSGGNPAETAAKMSAIRDEFSEKIKATLGESGASEFNEYEQTVPERMAVNQIAEQFNSAGTPLETTQKEALIQLMKTEKENSPPNPFDPQKSDPNTILSLLKDDKTFSAWQTQQQEYQNRVLQSAAKTLSPDQVSTLKSVLDQKMQQDTSAMQMFKATGNPPPNPPPRR